MKNMKKLAVFLLALVMVVSMSTTVLAANVVNQTTHDYVAYQIFSGTQDLGKAQLGDVNWGTGIEPVGLIAALKAANPELYKNVPVLAENYTAEEGKVAAEAVVAALIANGEGADYHADADQFANIAVNYVTGTGFAIAKNDTTANLPAGYYLIVDVTNIPEGEDDANNPALLQITNKGDILIAKKYNVPVVDKDILHNTEPKKLDEHSIGDTVHFRLTGTMANNLEDYNTYKVVFHDAMSAGLTFNEGSVVVTVDGTPITTGFEVLFGEEHDCTLAGTHSDCTFDVVFADIKSAPVDADGNALIKPTSKIVIEYTAVVNENAQINNDPNPNEVALEFSNNPNWKPEGSDDEEPTGITPWREVNVYTTEVGLTKKDGDGNILTGAEFALTGTSANVVIISKTEFVAWTTGDKYWKLTDGTYTSTAPTTEGIDTSVYVDVNTVYEKKVTVKACDTDAAVPVAAKAYVGDDGKLTFTGLGVGVYTLTETKTPAGYNTIDPLTLTVSFNENTQKFSYDWSWPGGQTYNSTANIVVFNNQGSVLPETGGVGTTMFYVCGGIMVAAAAILLISKKRKAED